MIKYVSVDELGELLNGEDSNNIMLDGEKMETKSELFDELSSQLEFPDYFGRNWDAVDECLQDLDWFNNYILRIFILNFDFVLSKECYDEKGIFVDCIKSANDFWELDCSKIVNFFFVS